MRQGLGVLASITILCLAISASAEVSKEEIAKLKGNWTVVGGNKDGEEMPPDAMKEMSFRIDDEKMTVVGGKREESAKIVLLDGSKSPGWLDLMPPKEDKPVLAIYKLDGDSLEICIAKEGDRPKDFEAARGHSLLKMKRGTVPPAPAVDAKEIAGTYSVASIERNGEIVQKDESRLMKFVIEGDTISIVSPDKTETAKIVALDSSKKPATIDIRPEREGKRIMRGIYQMRGNVLTIVGGEAGAERPQSIAEPGKGDTILTLHRVEVSEKVKESNGGKRD